ncbi:MAG: extracellular solute-binding protein [Melioribacteraceae bacterium]|nr:extracellular solute-binding protein [Melioribacteraceae bacterium]MCF8353296.1 extracellular solute-binding protein [Melioribacteraceae bacterium]MCF8395411.1 extracellular solute-binding protein [Melioribacteraceae bacterium]MCF8418823.1 extracellular solute-binding protein [Melioribacteraceae bacterium]
MIGEKRKSNNGKVKESYLLMYYPVGILTLAIVAIIIYVFLPLDFFDSEVEKPVEIYFATNVSSAHQAVIDEFNSKYSGSIKVVPINLSFGLFETNDRKELLTRSLRNKSDKMDIFEVDVIWVERFAKWCAKLDNLIPKEKLKGFLPHAAETCYSNNDLVAAPLYLDIGMIYYREDILRDLPEFDELKKELRHSITWEKFIDLRKKLNKPYYLFTGDAYEGLVVTFMELILSQNLDFFKNKPIDLNKPESRRALQFLHDLIYKYQISPIDVTHFNEISSYEYYLKNDITFLRGWPIYEKDDRNLYQEAEKKQNLIKAALPHFENSERVSVYGGWNVMVSEYTDKKKEIAKFIEFILEEDTQKKLYELGGYLPALKSIYNDKEFMENNPGLVYEKQLLDRGVPRPYSEDYTRISDIISKSIHQALLNEISIEVALNKATEYINSGKVLIK